MQPYLCEVKHKIRESHVGQQLIGRAQLTLDGEVVSSD